jgi:cell wall-associated NlpC family hydrolase
MKKCCLLLFLALILISCGSSRSISRSEPDISSEETKPKLRKIRSPSEKKITSFESSVSNEEPTNTLRKIRIDYARTFEGTGYKFGGTTKAGMDCSGLIYAVFKNEDVIMPRISRDMATKGVSVRSLNDVIEGDLVFFKTNKRNAINHVGLVVEKKNGEIFFIHSTTSRGVIISSLEENYWKNAFVEVRRII